ncbi:MAG: hypothetical protein HYR96_07865 [Deltaproteobacteria bacterium]|nr:hypothetical protein [Deltaproteobacteria bacterium]MBI3294490.1 hypothetical protein [Deltaproteobacteria bacterium]
MAKVNNSVYFTGLLVLEGLTLVGLFLIFRTQSHPFTGGAAELLGSHDPSQRVRGDLIPPPDILAKDITYNASFFQSNDLKSYLAAFPIAFARRLTQLGAKGRLLDAGAGEALFAEQLVSLEKDPSPELTFNDEREDLFRQLLERPLIERPVVVAVDVEIKRKDIPRHDGHLEILSGRLFEEIPMGILATFDVIVDNQGVLAFSSSPVDQTLGRYLAILREDGAIFVSLGSEDSNYAAASRVRTPDRGSISLLDWLYSIEGLSIQMGSVDKDHRALMISKVSRTVTLPRLKLESMKPRGSEAPVRFYVQER